MDRTEHHELAKIMTQIMRIFLTILKYAAGTVSGLIVSALIVVGLGSIFRFESMSGAFGDLWLIGGIVAVCVLLCNLLFLGIFPKKTQTPKIEHLPVSVSELINSIMDAMKYRRSVRAEVRQELADHFADALADCKDENERNALAQTIIEDFGDAKLLGVLLRRAKKRCRPLWRTMVVRTFQAVGIIVVLLIAYIGWFLSGKPVITTNYLDVMNRQVRPVADDSQNAWPYYREAAEKFIEPIDDEFDTSPCPPSTLTPEHRELLLQWIADNQQPLDLVRQGNQKPYYWQAYGHGGEAKTELVSVLLPHLGDYRHLVFLMCWQALLKAEDGDLELAFDDFLEVYSFGRHLRGQHTTLVEQLVAIAIEAMAVAQLRTIADAHLNDLNVSLLNTIRQRFQQKISEHDFKVSFESKKLFMYDELQRSFTQTRFGRSHLYLPRLSELGLFGIEPEQVGVPDWFSVLAVLHPRILTHPDREETREQIEHFCDVIEGLGQKTPASLRKENIEIDKHLEDIAEKNLFLKMLTPALGKVSQLSYRIQADSVATLTILAVLQYEKTHGEYPDSLEILVEAGLLEALPMDPFSDQPLVYRRTEDGFTLYSVGLNITDDGGVLGNDLKKGTSNPWSETGDAVFWPVTEWE